MLEQRYRKLAEGYRTRKGQLREEQEELWRNSNNPEEQIREIRREEEIISQNERNFTEQHEQDLRREEQSIKEIEGRRGSLSEKYGRIEESIREEFEAKSRKLGDEFEANKKNLGDEFERLRDESTEAIENRNSKGHSRIFGRIKDILDGRANIDRIEKQIENRRRLRVAKEILDSKDYKAWLSY